MKELIQNQAKRILILIVVLKSISSLAFSQQKTNIDYGSVTENLINEHADNATVALYDYLRSEYGQNIISGQTSYWQQLIEITGKEPVLRAFDFQSYTQGYPYVWQDGGHTFGWFENGTTQQAINWYKSTNGQGIVTFQWHWHSPFGGNPGSNTFYSWLTNFSVINAITPGTPENLAVIQDIDSIASQLKRLEAVNVPVLFRPLHEAGGHGAMNGSNAWFWWGSDGAIACLTLYDMIYDRITYHHGINNLIWVWSDPHVGWYPGNDKVDILGYDSYPGAFNYSPNKPMFDHLYNIVQGEKIIAMSENGPIPDIDQCIAQDAMWSYFSAWSNLVVEQNSIEHIQAVYNHPNVLTLSLGNHISVAQPIPQFSNPFHPELNETFQIVNLREVFSLSDDAGEDSELSFVLENNTNPDLAMAFLHNDTILMLEVYAGRKGSGNLDIWASAQGSRSVRTVFEFTIYDPEEKDHLLYQLATSSSIESNNHLPEYAVDGRNDRRWSSQYRDNEWISVEMDEAAMLERVMLHWEHAYGKHYKIEVSVNGIDWVEVYEETCSHGGYDQILFDPIEAKHVRMNGITRGTQFGFSLWSFEAYTFTYENQPPFFTGNVPDQQIIANQSLTATIPRNIVSDPNVGDRLHFNLLQVDGNPLPDWITFDDCTLQFQAEPLPEHSGEYLLKVLVTDSHGEQAESEPFSLLVEPFIFIHEIIVTGQNGASEIHTPGGRLRMFAEILPANATQPGFTWSADDTEIATISSVGILTAVSEGVVTVTAKATDGSGVTGQMEVIISFQNVSDQLTLEQSTGKLAVYPNPANNRIYIVSTRHPLQIAIYNINGQKILLEESPEKEHILNIEHLDPGFYILTTMDQAGQLHRKSIIKH